MKKFKLLTGDVYDLSLVLTMIIKEQAAKLTFKEILKIQKLINYFVENIKDFSETYSAITEDKNVFVKNANEKITLFKQELTEGETSKDPEVIEKNNKEVTAYVETVTKEAQNEIDKEITPRYAKLYDVEGRAEVSLEIEEDKHKILVEVFELYAKEKYNDKNKMVFIYDTITSA